MATPFLGEIKLVPYNFAPQGWAFAAGQVLSIQQYTALFSLLGTTYGGDGIRTFQLPDLRGRAALHHSSNYVVGETGGTETHTLTTEEMPAHNHSLSVGSELATSSVPGTNLVLATTSDGLGFGYGSLSSNLVAMEASAISSTGESQPHENRMPYLTLNYIIALVGIFPSQT